MSTPEELEDDISEEEQGGRDEDYGGLFGDEEDEQDQQPQEGAEAPAAGGGLTAQERKARLAQLAGLVGKRKKEQDEDGEGKKKKKHKSKEGKDGDKSSKKRSEGKVRPQRTRNTEEGEEAGGAEGEDAPAVAAQEPEDDVQSDEIEEEEADRAFIDDEGAEPASGGEEDDEAHIDRAEEAEEGEEDEVDRMIKGKKRKKERDTRQDGDEVVNMIAKMEAAFEDDWEIVCKNQGVNLMKGPDGSLLRDSEGNYRLAGQPGPPPKEKYPAISKLKMIQEVETFLSQRKYHELFIAQGGLGVLKSWLEPYQDGSLPNVRVRTSVLKVLQTLPIDTRMEDMKESLKRSKLGKNVMFLFKCSDETTDNRRLAKELVHKWSRPIFYDQDAEEAKKKQHEVLLAEARKQSLIQRQKQDEAAQNDATRAKAVRIHALIPQGSKLDYVVNPQKARDISAAAEVTQARSGHRDDSLAKKLREQQRKLKASSARAMKPSVEGRNIVLMH